MSPVERLLDVSVVAIAFRSGLEAAETFQTALALDTKAKCLALVSSAEAERIRASWPDEPERALLIFRTETDEGAKLACELIERLPDGPVAVLLANLPAPRGFLAVSRKKSDAELIRRLESAHPDVQVHLHSAEWLRRPPRIR